MGLVDFFKYKGKDKTIEFKSFLEKKLDMYIENYIADKGENNDKIQQYLNSLMEIDFISAERYLGMYSDVVKKYFGGKK